MPPLEEAGAVGGAWQTTNFGRPKQVTRDFISDLKVNGYLVLPRGPFCEEEKLLVAKRWRSGERLPQQIIEAFQRGKEAKDPPTNREEERRRKNDARLRVSCDQNGRVGDRVFEKLSKYIGENVKL